jgi:large subunit ribosomal protein L6
MKIPRGVEIKTIGEAVYVRGKLGIQKAIVEGVRVEGGEIKIETGEGREVVRRMIQGVSEGYKGKIKINGVGYRAVEQGGEVKLTIGYKDEKVVKLGEGVKVEISGNGTIITGRSARYEDLRSTLGRIIEVRPARKDRYKGKGIK